MNSRHSSTNAWSGHRGLGEALAALETAAIVPQAAVLLAENAEQTTLALRDAVLGEIPAFLVSGNPEILPGLEAHGRAHVEEILRLFGGGVPGGFEFVVAHVHRRAEQRFPIELILHAYRCGHRVLSRWIRDAAAALQPAEAEAAVAAVADFAIEYTNAISTVAASEYVAQARVLAEAERDLRSELLGVLIAGYDESDGRVARLLKRAGFLEQRQSYCVVVAQSANAAEMENAARAQRIAAAVEAAFSAAGIRSVVGVRGDLVTAVLSDLRRQSGWTAPRAALAGRARERLLELGPTVLVGVSADHPSTAFVPKALQEAIAALEIASVDRRVVAFADLPVRALLVRRGKPQIRLAPPPWLEALTTADAQAESAFVATLRAVADADMNVQKAARALRRHPNTVYARIERVRELTGLDPRRYHDLTELLLAVDCRAE